MTSSAEMAAQLRLDHPTVKFTVNKQGFIYAYDKATLTPIKERPFDGPEFIAKAQQLAGNTRPSDSPVAGMLAAAFDDFRDTRHYRKVLSARTRKDYEQVLHWMRPAALRIELKKFTPADVEKLINRAEEVKWRKFANTCLVVLRLALDRAVLNDWVDRNVARIAGIKPIPRPRGMPAANPPWPDEAREIVLAHAKGGVLAILATCMFTGMRESDAVNLTELDYDGMFVRWVPSKTDDQDDPMLIPVHPRLKAILDPIAAQRRQVVAVVGNVIPLQQTKLITGVHGEPYTEDGFRTMWHKLRDRLRREGKLPAHWPLTVHGLRHSVGAYLAETGASQEMIMAVLNHKTLAMSALYTARANKKRLRSAAVAMLYPEVNG